MYAAHCTGKKLPCFQLRYAMLIFCIAFLALPAFSRGGLLAGQKNIRYIQTEWFDIIFPEESTRAAEHIASHADRIFAELAETYGLEAMFRMPVTISPANDSFNAFYTNGAYNHIVLYDTSPDEDFAVFSDTLLSTFTHELTHAVTYNHTSSVWRTFQRIFGDSLSWGTYVTNGFLAESATVSYESKDGEGRMHDGFFLHLVRQAKLQGTFPKRITDVSGSRDTFPVGEFYYYGGPFASWLQETYGMQKYANWWYACNSLIEKTDSGESGAVHTWAGYFNSIYGKPLKTAWSEFEASLAVPTVPQNPLEEEHIYDFFTLATGGTQKSATGAEFSRQNQKGALYGQFSACQTGFAYRDENTNCVYFVRVDDDGTPHAPKKLFSRRHVNRIALSRDGRFMAVSVYNVNHASYKNEVLLYDMECRSWHTVKEPSLRDATVFFADGAYHVLGVHTASQNASLRLFKVVQKADSGKVQDFVSEQTESLAWGDSLFAPCDAGNGEVACIFKTGLTWTIRLYTYSLGGCSVTAEYALPETDMRARNLSVGTNANGETILLFSWTQENTFPRLGMFNRDTKTFLLDAKDTSGGVYNPVLFGTTVFYSGFFVHDYKLLCRTGAETGEYATEALYRRTGAQEKNGRLAEGQPREMGAFAESDAGKGEGEETLGLAENQYGEAKPYWGIYYKRGMWLVAATIPQYDRMLSETSAIVFPGVTYMTHTPWNSDTLEVSLGFDIDTYTAGLMCTFSGSTGATGTSLFSYAERPQVLFDPKGFKQAVNTLRLKQEVQVGAVSELSFVEQNVTFVGRQQTANDSERFSQREEELEKISLFDVGAYIDALKALPGSAAAQDTENYVTTETQLQTVFSCEHKMGAGIFESGGLSFSLTYYNRYNTSFKSDAERSVVQALVPAVRVRLPRLLPITCKQDFTYNLPFAAEAAWFGLDDTLLQLTGEAILFSAEIQKGYALVPLYFKRLIVSASYEGAFKKDCGNFQIVHFADDIRSLSHTDYEDCLKLNIMLTTGGTINLVENIAGGTFGVFVGYSFNRAKEESPWHAGLVLSSLF